MMPSMKTNTNAHTQNCITSIAQRLGTLATAVALALSLGTLPACSLADILREQPEDTGANAGKAQSEQSETGSALDLAQIPAYAGTPYVVVNDNVPNFDERDADNAPESYSELDALGRCGVAEAVVSLDTMPTEERGEIGMIKPSGWHTVRYDGLVEGDYLYNRSHLIGFQLTGENANERNLITGTRYMNAEGMEPFESEVAAYVKSTGNRVLYRATPVFADDELVARGVHLEAMSVEDGGAGVSFSVFCYNVQPGVAINYATGESWRDESGATEGASDPTAAQDYESQGAAGASRAQGGNASAHDNGSAAGGSEAAAQDYVLNTNTMRFHYPDCESVDQMNEDNKREATAVRDEIIAQGYEPCGECRP